MRHVLAQENPFFETVFNFPPPPLSHPGPLIQAGNGKIYGITKESQGSIYEYTIRNGAKRLARFDGRNGASPNVLIEGQDGNLYGTTFGGGVFGDYGTIFKITPSGDFTTLHSFDGTNGAKPIAFLQAKDGDLYTVAQDGPGPSGPAIYKLTLAGDFTAFAVFDSTLVDSDPVWSLVPTSLIQASDGNFYGMAHDGFVIGGGENQRFLGVIFRLSMAGKLSIVRAFSGDYGANLHSLLQAPDGTFYGLTTGGGEFGWGGIFKVDSSGQLTQLVDYPAVSSLVQSAAGVLYGTTFESMFEITPTGEITNLVSMAGDVHLVRGSDASLYGTTSQGGSPGGSGYGTIFRLTNSAPKTLFSFGSTETTSASCIIQDTNGDFYGIGGGGFSGNGTFFRLTASGTLTTLLSFDSENSPLGDFLVQGGDGAFYTRTLKNAINRITRAGKITTVATLEEYPSVLIYGRDGNFYGITGTGGGPNPGKLFRVTPSGSFSTLALFDGTNSFSQVLIQGLDGELYAAAGNAILKLDSSGRLAAFANIGVGGGGISSLVQASDMNLYGVNEDKAFKVSTSGEVSILHSLTFGSSILPGDDGDFYGTSFRIFPGWVPGPGTVFKLSASGILTTLATYDYADGIPASSLVHGRDGHIYGTSYWPGQRTSSIVRLRPPPDLKTIARNSERTTVTWRAYPNRDYQLEFVPSIDSSNWQAIGGTVHATNSLITVDDVNRGPRAFYRVHLVR